MSRYEFLPHCWSSTYSLAVGWDEPLQTYFAQVFDTSISEDDDRVIVWIGGLPPYYTDLGDMKRALNDGISGKLPAITLSKDMQAMLRNDRIRTGQASRWRGRPPRQRQPVFALDLFPDYKPMGK
jgi:hypothetical protein